MDKEKADAIRIANSILDNETRDHVTDLEILSRQFLLALERQNWQPIETAPKGRRSVLGCDEYGEVLETYRDGKKWMIDSSPPFEWDPIYWMDMPDPPGKE